MFMTIGIVMSTKEDMQQGAQHTQHCHILMSQFIPQPAHPTSSTSSPSAAVAQRVGKGTCLPLPDQACIEVMLRGQGP